MIKIIIKIKTFILKQIVDIKTYGIKEFLRKFYLFIKILVSIPINVIAIVPCVIIRLISPWIIVRIAEVPRGNYANLARDTALYCCKKKLNIDQPPKKNIDLLYVNPNDKIYNKQLVKMWKRKLNFFPGHILEPIKRVNGMIPGWEKHEIELFSAKLQKEDDVKVNGTEMDVDNLFEKYQPLDFTNKEEVYGKNMLKKFGLEEHDKFVCLAVRDGAYQIKKIPSRFRDWSYQDYRHYDIDNFVLAAEELAKRGYYVFRVGVVVEKPFNLNNPKIIDYANSNLRNDFMDVYLAAKCSFCISTGFGFDEVPIIFQRPIALLIVPLGDLRAYTEKFFLMTKHHVLKKEKRKLSLSEIFSHGVAYAHDTKIFEQKGIELIDNTPDEIKDFVIEMVDNIEFKKNFNHKDEELQKTFKDLFTFNIKRFDYRKEVENPKHVFHGPIRFRFSTEFLRKNKNWLR